MTQNDYEGNAFWERQSFDTDTSYAIFAIYRDMGITRSLRKAAGMYYHQDPAQVPKSSQLVRVKKWSREGMWKARVEAHDAEEEDERRKLMKQHQLEMFEQHRKLARLGLSKIAQTLQNMGAKDTIPMSQMPSFLQACANLERLTMGLSTENVRIDDDTREEMLPDYSMLSDEELDHLHRIGEKLYGE